jgi:transposase, IS5 family
VQDIQHDTTQKIAKSRQFIFSFECTLNHNHPLFILANKVYWQLFEKAFNLKKDVEQTTPSHPRLVITRALPEAIQ